MAQIAEGVRYYEGEGSILTVRGQRREVFLTVSLPTQPHDFRRVLVTLMDVTERKRAEEALRRSEANLAKAQEIAHVGSWEWEIEPNRVSCSDETYRILGLEPQSRSLRFPDIVDAVVHPDDRKRVKEIVAAALRQPNPWFVEIRLALPDGSERVAYLRRGRVRGGAGRCAWWARSRTSPSASSSRRRCASANRASGRR